jgi:hypothetical protein
MPKKPSMHVVMQNYPLLSTRRWHMMEVLAVRKMKVGVCFELAVLDDPHQAGRTLAHNLPAVLTPNSPLSRFLADGFGVHLTEHQSFDLATIVGRQFQARFDKGADGHFQAIVAVRPFNGTVVQPDQVNRVLNQQEQTNGLG